MTKILIGADPEFFLTDVKTKQPVSAHGLVPGTKKKPHKLECGAVQLDGTAVEFNIDPAGTAFEFEYNVTHVLKQVREMIPAQYDFNFSPTVQYPPKYFESIPEIHKELGCDPDYNALNGDPTRPNVMAARSATDTFRTGAGHLHVGFVDKKDPLDEVHFWDCVELSKRLAEVYNSVSRIWDRDTKRTLMYGAGAAFRPKPYGVEFRSPSNAWLNYPKLWGWLFELTKEIYYRTAESDARMRDFDALYYRWDPPSPADIFKRYQKKAAELKLPRIPDDWKDKVAA